MDYLGTAERVAGWLLHTARRDAEGWWWPAQPEVSDETGPQLGWGTLGPSLFFIELARTTGDRTWLEPPMAALPWMEHNLASVASEGFAGLGLFTGIGGWAFVADLLAETSGSDRARALAEQALATIADRATPVDAGVHWHDITEILWGTAGIGCLLLAIGDRHLDAERVRALAVGAGDWLISQAEEAGPGIRWSVGAGVGRGPWIEAARFPNFAHGAAGIGFFLARLAEVTGETRFADAALRAAEWILSTAATDDDTCAAYHDYPDNTDERTLGWCHGPPGLGWFFRQLELTTGDSTWRSWVRRAANADVRSGMPERLYPGFWDNVGRCCGSAGVAEFFLDLHTLEGRSEDLAFAQRMVDDAIGRATVDDTGLRWSNIEHTADDPVLPATPAYLQGASGIGSTVLRLHRHLASDAWVVPWPHAPAWS